MDNLLEEHKKFFEKEFPFINLEKLNENELIEFFTNKEQSLLLQLLKINSQINEKLNYKLKNLCDYYLKENLTIEFNRSKKGSKIIKKINKIYEKLIDNKFLIIDYDSFINAENDETKRQLINKFIQEYLKKFDIFLNQVFIDIKQFPEFIIKKYYKLITEKILTNISINNIDISDIGRTIDEEKINLIFNDYFINKTKKNFLNKSYFNFLLLSNYEYFNNINGKNIFILYSNFKYLFYIFNLNKNNNTSDYEINKELDLLLKENNEISLEEKNKKLKTILNEFKENSKKNNFFYYEIILLFTLISNFLIQKDLDNKEISIILSQNFPTSPKFKIIFENCLKHFDDIIDVTTLINYIESILIQNILEYKQNFQNFNEIYNYKKIKNILSSIEEPNYKLMIKDFFDLCEKKKLNLNSISLENLNSMINSTNLTILISGFLSDNEDHIEEWDNLTLDFNKYHICYYYNWPGENAFSAGAKTLLNISNIIFKKVTGKKIEEQDIDKVIHPEEIFINAMNNAKYSGQLLACILVCKKFFNIQTINLIGFSLGCHVIKNCIKFLYNIEKKYKIDCSDIIKDVYLIAGATTIKKEKIDIYRNIFSEIINGKLVNAFSNEDEVLNKLYEFARKKKPIGNSKLDLGDFQKLINVDFTSLHMGHTDYRKNMDLVIEKINLLT